MCFLVVQFCWSTAYPTPPDTKVVKPSSASPKSEPEMPIIPTNINPPPIIPVHNSELVKPQTTTKIPISSSQSAEITAYCADTNSAVTSLSPTFNADAIKIINEIKTSYQNKKNEYLSNQTKDDPTLKEYQKMEDELQNQITPINPQIEKIKPRITALDKDIADKIKAIEQSRIHKGYRDPKTEKLQTEHYDLIEKKELAEKEIGRLEVKEKSLLEQIRIVQRYKKSHEEQFADSDASDKQRLDEHIPEQINKHFDIQK
ncbi:hypothetical protein ATP_00258 [Candidatus Phytoplasma mali]|uniref:Uncharacterized protein n=1 Tax=Phytoplasma mali (strain AT) TaxID=482235 RepID=B3QZQ8_PHYMT|nr:hypothetical protein [Candidatus Phytoplasma mali]CAP18445.1 hypothetical protein ATP_00258 [Candidatus Phytoplasma mali]